jgi:O-antigen ligase
MKQAKIIADKDEKKLLQEAGDEKALVPRWIYYAAFFVTFAVPNLVFSGRNWFDTLHIMKWFVTMAPIGVVVVIAGFNLFHYGASRTNFRIDAFSAGWLVIIFLVTSQPVFLRLTSMSTFIKEWFFLATLFAVYLCACNMRIEGRFFRVLLWGCSVNASINVLFAELMIRGIDTGLPFIMNVPGNYIGNTAQQEMLGLWIAMALLCCIFLHIHYAGAWSSGKPSRALSALNILFMVANACGLWRTTTRGAILALFVGFIVLLICFARNRAKHAVIHLCSLLMVVLLFFALVVAINPSGGTNRGAALVNKLLDMVTNPGTFGGRIAIWRVSNEIFLKHPIGGVGLGHYKWHFLDGQGAMFGKYPQLLAAPGYKWQYTYWAHSEYLQWLCETGLIGFGLTAAFGFWWLYRLAKTLLDRKTYLPVEAIWGVAMLFLLFLDALFSRPFHRIENAVWMSLAFAQANRFILPDMPFAKRESELVYKAFGAFIASAAVCGLIFMAGGMMGDKLLLKAIYPISDGMKREYITSAERYLMSREDAEEQLANLDISIGEQSGDDEMYIRGVGRLFAVFQKRPNSERLFKLFDCARELNSVELMGRLIPYLPPGTVSVR